MPPARDLTPVDGVRAYIYSVPKNAPDVIIVGLNDRDAAMHDVYRLDIDSGELLPETLHWAKWTGASWTPDSLGFFYSRYPEPVEGEDVGGYIEKLVADVLADQVVDVAQRLVLVREVVRIDADDLAIWYNYGNPEIAVLGNGVEISSGDTTRLSWPQDCVHLFETQTGKRVPAADAHLA